MCGRFTLSANAKRLEEFFPMFEIPDYKPRFNVAPTQQVLAVLQNEGENVLGGSCDLGCHFPARWYCPPLTLRKS